MSKSVPLKKEQQGATRGGFKRPQGDQNAHLENEQIQATGPQTAQIQGAPHNKNGGDRQEKERGRQQRSASPHQQQGGLASTASHQPGSMSGSSKPQSKVLFDLKECEHLYQKDKSNKQLKNIQQIKDQIKRMKERETNYYLSLLLDDKKMKKVFDLSPPKPYDKRQEVKIIADDPIQGKLVMTPKEFEERYNQRLNVPFNN